MMEGENETARQETKSDGWYEGQIAHTGPEHTRPKNGGRTQPKTARVVVHSLEFLLCSANTQIYMIHISLAFGAK